MMADWPSREKILQLQLSDDGVVTLVDIGTAMGLAVQDATGSAVVRLEPADADKLREWLNAWVER